MRKFVEQPLHKFTTKKTFSSPSSLQSYFLNDQVISSQIIQSQVYPFVRHLLVKVALVKTFHKGIDGSIGVLKAANEKLTLSDACLLYGGVALNICHWEVSIKNFVISLFSY